MTCPLTLMRHDEWHDFPDVVEAVRFFDDTIFWFYMNDHFRVEKMRFHLCHPQKVAINLYWLIVPYGYSNPTHCWMYEDEFVSVMVSKGILGRARERVAWQKEGF